MMMNELMKLEKTRQQWSRRPKGRLGVQSRASSDFEPRLMRDKESNSTQ